MSRRFNTKKFIKVVLNDRYALVIGNEIILDTKTEFTYAQRTAIQSVVEVLLYPSFGSAKEMAGSSHTLACCLSKLRSSLQAGKKQPRVWLQYVCNVAEVLFDRRSNRVERIWCSERQFHDSNKRNRLLYTHAESVKILHFRHHFGAQSKDYSYLCTVKTN
jgi:hypothetical protein